MQNKLSILLAISIILFIGINYYDSNKTKPKAPKTNFIKPKKPQKKIETQTKPKPTGIYNRTTIPKEIPSNPTISEFNTEKYTSLLEELTYEKYSSDPIEELFSIAKEVQWCKSSTQILDANSDKIQNYQTFKNTLEQDCKKIFKTYPNIKNIKSDKQTAEFITNNFFNSKYYDLFSRMFAKEKSPNLSKDIITTFLKSKNAQFISSLPSLHRHFSIDFLHNKVQTKIGGDNNQYIELITQQALEIFACQFNDGITCKPSSKFMLRKCVKNSDLCGKGILFWYENYISSGHRNDIEQAIDMLKNNFSL